MRAKKPVRNSTRVQTFKKGQIIKTAVLHHSSLSLMMLEIAGFFMNIESMLPRTTITRIIGKCIVFILSQVLKLFEKQHEHENYSLENKTLE